MCAAADFVRVEFSFKYSVKYRYDDENESMIDSKFSDDIVEYIGAPLTS